MSNNLSNKLVNLMKEQETKQLIKLEEKKKIFLYQISQQKVSNVIFA